MSQCNLVNSLTKYLPTPSSPASLPGFAAAFLCRIAVSNAAPASHSAWAAQGGPEGALPHVDMGDSSNPCPSLLGAARDLEGSVMRSPLGSH